MTIYDIAREAGVSASTVSRVINNKAGIKESTRKKVQKLLDEYNYTPDVAARGLGAGGRHRHRVLPQNQNSITKQPGGVPKAEASRLRFYKLCAPFGYLSRALWSAPPMVKAARTPVWVQTTTVSSGASGSAASRASTETVVERESRVVNTRVFTP